MIGSVHFEWTPRNIVLGINKNHKKCNQACKCLITLTLTLYILYFKYFYILNIALLLQNNEDKMEYLPLVKPLVVVWLCLADEYDVPGMQDAAIDVF